MAASLTNLMDTIVAPGVKRSELKQAVSILMYPVITFNKPQRHNGSYNRLLGDLANNQTLTDYYSMEKQVTKKTPPTFLVHAKDDLVVPLANSIMYLDNLKKFKKHMKLPCLECGYVGLMGVKTEIVPWYVSGDWVRLSSEHGHVLARFAKDYVPQKA